MTARVLQVLGRSAGGIARHVGQVVEFLDGTQGLSIDIAGPDDLPVPMPKEVRALHIPDGAVKGHRAAIRRLREIVTAGDYDVVHAHGLRAAIDSGMATRGSHVPVVTTVHNLVLREIAGRKAILHRRAESLAVRSSEHVFAVSEQIAQHLRATVGDSDQMKKIETLHLGIGDPPVVHRGPAEIRAELGVPDGHNLVVTASRLSAQKALDVMLEAIARLSPTTFLAVLGEGPLQERLVAQAGTAGIADRVRFLGFRRDGPDFIAAADVFCLSSLWEGVPLAAQEAILLRTPVVATDVGGMNELITDGVSGRLVPSGDPAALAAALSEVLDSETLRAGYIERALADLKTNFSTEAMLQRLSALYKDHAVARV